MPTPGFAVLLTGRRPAEVLWPHRWVRWPDLLPPTSTADAVDALVEAYRRTPAERVEVACGGGVGRTGTAPSLLAVPGGVPVDEAVGWVRERHTTGRWRRRGSTAGS